jgi:hypothetical protein
VPKLYNAIAFAMRHYGLVMNCHATLAWSVMGVEDHRQSARLLTSFNHEARKWLAVGGFDEETRRCSARALLGGSRHVYAYVHEYAREQGFHTHQLMVVPPEKAERFGSWANACLRRLSGRSLDERATCFKFHKPKNEADAVARCWSWFRYATKGLSETLEIADDEGGWRSARDIFKPYPAVNGDPVSCHQIAGGAHAIWTKAQRIAGFRSRFDTGDWERLYDGHELEERRQAIKEEARRQQTEALLRTLNL